MLILGLLGMYFDAVVVFVNSNWLWSYRGQLRILFWFKQGYPPHLWKVKISNMRSMVGFSVMVFFWSQNISLSLLDFYLTTGFWWKEARRPPPKWNTRFYLVFSISVIECPVSPAIYIYLKHQTCLIRKTYLLIVQDWFLQYPMANSRWESLWFLQ